MGVVRQQEMLTHVPQGETLQCAGRSQPLFSMVAYLFSILVAVAASYAFSHRSLDSLPATSVQPDRLQVNDLAVAGKRVVAVGEAGAILVSDDDGRSWHGTRVEPQRHLMLTAVTFLTDKVGLAVGWDGQVLRTEDGGEFWQETRHEADFSEPLLGVWGRSGESVYAFGSYGRFFESADQGAGWQARDLPVDGRHVNGMDGHGDHLMVVGEEGVVLRSFDRGESWEGIPQFFGGSFYGVAALSTQDWVAYGMRGSIYVTHDFGEVWVRADVSVNAPLHGHLIDTDGRLTIVGAGGLALVSEDRGRSFGVRRAGEGTLTSLARLADGSLLFAGDHGIVIAHHAKN